MRTLKSLVLLAIVIVATITDISFSQNAANYLVTSLPGIPQNVNYSTYAGYINTLFGTANSSIFFWLIRNQFTADRQRLIIWLNDPGCSSLSGLFFEVGPWRLIDSQTLTSANESWNQYANLLFVDQPVGSGYSFTFDSNNYLRNFTTESTGFLQFLDAFITIFPEFTQEEMYIAGENYAGTLISYVASAILARNNQTSTPTNLRYNLQGIAIGNGWIDPRTQYTAQYTYALSNNLISGIYKTLIDSQLALCLEALRNSTTVRVDSCEQTFGLIVNSTEIGDGNNATCVNKYDIRDRTSRFPACGDDWPYSLPTLQTYLNRQDVITAIHANVTNLTWIGCNAAVTRLLFNSDRSGPAFNLFPDILRQIKVLLFDGDSDLICNSNGTESWIRRMTWNNATGFQNQTTTPWIVNNVISGRMISERNLTYVIVYNSSRMVPADQPRIRDVMYRFMGLNQNFVPS
ncbi:peptidase S10, serine carboxypeptidase [Gigaspora rosea]|uniref:Pheromone-processing carboxypeptidase KEX1 n=1 Tax=Gigaspora rosea TaxID=44941 RepID=A0A397V7V3_9GLOM|nr:peptidase S10, serine carboxypeptidase [Gigaspora rosea]